MYKTLKLGLLSGALFSGLMIVGGAAQAAAPGLGSVAAAPVGVSPIGQGVGAKRQAMTWTATCSSGNFRGEVKGTHSYVPGSSVYRVQVDEYRIVKSNGQQGGNKANINVRLGHAPNFSNATGWNRSPDRMIQNGQWFAAPDNLWHQTTGQGDLTMATEFIFDKSGPDPRCKVDTLIPRPH